MSVSKRSKIVIGVLLFLVALGVAAPFVAHALVKSKIDAKLQNEFGDLAHYDDIAIVWSPLGATLTNLRLGDPNPNAGNEPTMKIASADIMLHSVFDSEPHLTNVTAHGFSVTIFVDERGESSLTKLIREKQPSKRTRPLTIDALTIDGATLVTYVASKSNANAKGAPDSTVRVARIQASNFIVPIPGQLLGKEEWIPTTIEGLDAFEGNAVQGATPAARIGKITLELDQAETTEMPVKLRKFKAEQSHFIVIGAEGKGLKRVINSIQSGFGIKEPSEISDRKSYPDRPQGTGLLIEDFEMAGSEIEIRGGDGAGTPAFWRLNGAGIQAGNLAFGEKVTAAAPGFLKLQSTAESSGAPGSISISLTDLGGQYPRSSFACAFRVEHVPAAAFAAEAESAQHVRVKSGSMTLDFSGGAKEGQLNLDGSVTLSNDFEIEGSAIKSAGVELIRGKPLEHVTVDGTLEHPQIHLPQELALLADIIGAFAGKGPFGVINATAGKIPVIGPVVKEVTKTTGGVLGKIPVIGGLFKSDKDKEKEKDK